MPGRCGRGSVNDGLFIVLQEVPGGGYGPQADLLGVPNSTEEEVNKQTLDEELASLESTLLVTGSNYKLTKNQRENWIKYAVIKEIPLEMLWEDVEEKKKKQGNKNTRLVYILQVHQPDYECLKNLCQIAKQCKIWHKHWEIPESKSQQGEKERYIQMVQTHVLVQLSLRAALINEVIDADSKFLLQLSQMLMVNQGTQRKLWSEMSSA
jgi:hypothetical protein